MMLHVMVPLLACVVSALMAGLIWMRNASDPASRPGTLLVATGAVWAFCEVMWNIQPEPEGARLFLRLSGFGWAFLGPLAFDTMRQLAAVPADPTVRVRPWLYVVSGGFLLATLFTPWMHEGVVRTAYGWGYRVGWLHLVFALYTVGCIAAGVRIGWHSQRRATPGERAQVRVVGGGITLAVVVGATTDALLPLLGIQTMHLGTSALAIFALSIGWAFHRYGYSLLAPGPFAQEILATLPNGVALLRLDGRIRTANDTLAGMLRCRPEALVGRGVQELLRDHALDLESEIAEVECQMRTAKGTLVPAALATSFLRDRQDHAIGIVLVVRDVSEVASLRNRLVMADRLAAVGEMAAGIAHEINNPLAYVRSNLSLLRRHWESLENEISKSGTPDYAAVLMAESEEMIDESLQGVDRAVAIVRDVRGLAHAATSERESADVNALIDGVLRMAKSQIDRTVAIEKDLKPLPPLTCTPQELQQVFLNLVMNAGQAVAKNGNIAIATDAVGDDIVVTIRDDGCGISPEMQDRIFEPFFTTKPVGEGTGLGLGIALEIVRRHAGSIEVRSETGRGTEFCVRLPTAADRMEPRSQP